MDLTSRPVSGRSPGTTYDLASLGWDTALAATYTEYAPASADHRPGRVAHAATGVCTVLTADGVARASLAGSVLAAAAADLTALPCPGDWVVLRRWPDRKVTVEAVLPRRGTVRRAVATPEAPPRGRVGHPIVANVDVAVVVEPVALPPDTERLARLLALAGESGARVLVLLSRADPVPVPEAVAADRGGGRGPRVTLASVGVTRPESVAVLRPLLAPGRTLAVLGPPTPGRSALVDALVGARVMADRRAGAALVPVPGRGVLVDAPESWHPTDLREGPLLRIDPARSARVT